MTQGRRGVVLLEAIVAVTVLAIAGLSAATWIRQTEHTLVQTRHMTTQVRAASRYLDIIALWTRTDLDRHLGERHEGSWIVYIARPTTTIYSIIISDSAVRVPLLRTLLYRPEQQHVTH